MELQFVLSRNPIKNEAVVSRFPSIRGAGSENEALKKRPFLVRHQAPGQSGLHHRWQLESHLQPSVNLFCHHGLGSAPKSPEVDNQPKLVFVTKQMQLVCERNF